MSANLGPPASFAVNACSSGGTAWLSGPQDGRETGEGRLARPWDPPRLNLTEVKEAWSSVVGEKGTQRPGLSILIVPPSPGEGESKGQDPSATCLLALDLQVIRGRSR